MAGSTHVAREPARRSVAGCVRSAPTARARASAHVHSEARHLERALPIIRNSSVSSAHLALLGDKSLLFSESGRAFLMCTFSSTLDSHGRPGWPS